MYFYLLLTFGRSLKIKSPTSTNFLGADFLSFFSSCLIKLAMSVIYYKFKAAKDSDYDVFTFDGQGATVFDVKRDIIRAKFGKGTDFDLAIYNAQTDEGKKKKMRQK